MIKELICYLKSRHKYVQYNRPITKDNRTIFIHTKKCRLCGRVKVN